MKLRVIYCEETEQYVGYLEGIAGAHSQGKSIEELSQNLLEVLTMIEDE